MSERRVLILTGAGGRLGSVFCRRHAAAYDIVAVHRSRPPGVASQEQTYVDPLDPGAALAENAHPVFSVRADLAHPGEVERVVDLALARFGRVDVLVNNAAHSVWAPMLGTRRVLEAMPAMFDVNVMVPLRLAVEVADRCWRDVPDENRALRRGVVNVSSTAGVHVYRGSHQGVYSATKAALNFLTAHMADEFEGIGVRVNAIAPNSFPRWVPTATVADAVARIDAGSGSGEVLVVDRDGERVVTY